MLRISKPTVTPLATDPQPGEAPDIRMTSSRRNSQSKAASGTRPLTPTPAASPIRRGSWSGSKREAGRVPDACRTVDVSRRFSAPATKQERILAEVLGQRVYNTEPCAALESELLARGKAPVAHEHDADTQTEMPGLGDMARSRAVEAGLKHFLFQELPDPARRMFVNSLAHEEFEEGAIIFGEGDQGDKLYIVHQGRIEFRRGPVVVNHIGKEEVFGELSIVYGTPRSASAHAIERSVLWALDRESFRKIMAILQVSQLEMTRTFLKGGFATRGEQSDELVKSPSMPRLALKNFEAVAMLGTGGFSTVTLVRGVGGGNDIKGGFFAMKAISKQKVVDSRMAQKILVEKQALQSVREHPACLQIIGTFQDRDCLYLITEAAEGGDLMRRMIKEDALSPEATMFYAACITLALEKIHSENYVHRDLKPEVCLAHVKHSPCARF